MEKTTFTIPNITCSHCVMAIKNELTELEGVLGVAGSADTKTVTVEWEAPATLETLEATLTEINYPAA